ncbi:carbohydrate ABC transporter permease [Nocardioides bruguierae]|uniref:Sugar ABC transporter permease n=1 Tax=Nocardioides bruguierae TaxID=2945102 RepID=A0A9X2ICJ7_9ACTN|nr:sugar ABC transporter permease [Nocardioides bruguierae]MCM0618786.1 sugar ABC transporter permease [Nocardioides bruguierae]
MSSRTASPPSVAEAPGPSVLTRRRQRTGWLFIAPFALVFTTFLVVPLGYAFWLSLHTKSLAFGTRFSGLENYTKAFTDPAFLEGVRRVLAFALVMVPLQLGIALVVALVLDSLTTRLAAVSRLLVFVPYAVPAVIGAMMWGFLYSPDFGPFTQLSELLGLPAPDLLDHGSIFSSLVNIVTWQWVGYYMVIIYSALQGIDQEIYEAAQLDGANGLQTALRVKVPMIASTMVLITVFSLIGTLQFFNEPTILQAVAPGAITPDYTPNMYAYAQAFSYSAFNYASAISFSLGLVTFLGSYVFLFLTRKRNGLS